MHIIETIYRNSIQPSEHKMRKDLFYTRAKNQEKQCYDTLCERLSEYERSVLNKLMLCHEKKSERKNAHCFTAGFKTGLSVAVMSLME